MSVQISARVDENTKEQFDFICKKIGLSVSGAINVFIQAVINENGIPFSLQYADNKSLDAYVKRNKKWLNKGLKQLKQGKVHTLTLSESD